MNTEPLPTSKRFIDLTGKRYGKLAVIGYAGRNQFKHHLWVCQCECGNKMKAVHGNLTNSVTRSCGCLQKDILSRKAIYKHGRKVEWVGSGEYSVKEKSLTKLAWEFMLAQERNLNSCKTNLSNVGESRIRIRKRWSRYIPFLKDMGKCPSRDHYCARIDKNKGWSKDNCRWEIWKA